MFAEGLNEKVCLECNRQFTGIVAACPHDGTLLVTKVQDPLIGTTLAGHYEIQSLVGHGGMGVVYRARHNLMDRIVAIKMLHSNLVSDSMSVKRFQQESKAASRISHPHVITVYDFGISPQGQPYIVMDYLEGNSLADVIKNEGQVGVERCMKIISQACDALEHAHRQGVVHRDLKPTNIVLIENDEDKDFVKVVDFGVAKLMTEGTDGQRLTQAGEVCGSPVYMSPEQCLGQELDARSDIYSMGICLYESLTGKLPIIGKTMVDTMSKHISEMPMTFSEARPDLYIPERLEAVVMKALAKSTEDRHQSMEEFKQDIDFAIPRPGRSQVLRTAPLKTSGAGDVVGDVLKKVSIKVWAAVFVAIIAIGVLVLKALEPKPALNATVPPPAIQQSTTPTPADTATKTATSTKSATAPSPAKTDEPATKSGGTDTAANPANTSLGTTNSSTSTATAPNARTAARTVAKSARKPHRKTATAQEIEDEQETAVAPGPRRAYSSYGHAYSPEDIVQATADSSSSPSQRRKRRAQTRSASKPAATDMQRRWEDFKSGRSY